jgi:hypothetical protein
MSNDFVRVVIRHFDVTHAADYAAPTVQIKMGRPDVSAANPPYNLSALRPYELGSAELI